MHTSNGKQYENIYVNTYSFGLVCGKNYYTFHGKFREIL